MVSPRPSVHLFVGDNEYLKEKAIADLKSAILKDSSGNDLDYKVFRGGEADFREVLDSVATIPFLSAKKLVVIKNIEDLDDPDLGRLIACIKKSLKTTVVVLDAKSDSVVSVYGELAGLASIKRFDGMTDAEFHGWVKKFVQVKTASGKKIEDDAVSQLKDLHGNNLTALSGEIEKLIAFTGERSLITLADVEKIAARSAFSSAFDLTRAIENNNPDFALSIASDLTAAGRKHHEIIGLLCWHLRRILRAKTLQAKGEPDSRVANILKIGRRYQDNFFKQANAIGIKEAREKLKILLEADLDIKRSRLDPTLILEFVIMKLCLGAG
ncbi:MAG: DNA polymerase III subunit delta [Candidatus Omnitrophota bacterium]